MSPLPSPTVYPANKRHRRHANPFTVRHDMSDVRAQDQFVGEAPMAVDVGCGPGRFLLELAQAQPTWHVLGLEIRPHLVQGAQKSAQEAGLQDRVACILANANMHLPSLLPEGGVVFISINFPDPWYKKRHHKRRVVQTAWLEALRPSLKASAQIHAMSDYLPVATHMRDTLDAIPWLSSMTPGPDWPTVSTTGLTTEREQTHMARGEPIYRMAYRLNA